MKWVLRTLPFPPPPLAYCWCLPWALLSWCDSPRGQKPNTTKPRNSHLLGRWPELADCNWSEWWLATAFSCKAPSLGFGVVLWFFFFCAWDNLKTFRYQSSTTTLLSKGDTALCHAAFPAAISPVPLFKICINPKGAHTAQSRLTVLTRAGRHLGYCFCVSVSILYSKLLLFGWTVW